LKSRVSQLAPKSHRLPIEIAAGSWTVKTPTDETFDVTVQ